MSRGSNREDISNEMNLLLHAFLSHFHYYDFSQVYNLVEQRGMNLVGE